MPVELLCPICGETLTKVEKSYRCENRHSFDIARQGHVNLLPVQNKRSLNPGDTAQQVVSRREFLDGGFYAPIREALCALAKDHGCAGPILDIGCGEGYYSAGLAESLNAELLGGALRSGKIQKRHLDLCTRCPPAGARSELRPADQPLCPDHAGGI